MNIKIAQIGVGYWGPNLLRNLVSNQHCTVKNVVELSTKRKEYVKNTYPNIDTTKSFSDVLLDNELDAVVIATPVNTHFKLVCEALSAGKHVLVEKPMASSVVEVEKIEKLANKMGLVAMVGHTFLYNSAVRYIKKIIDSGEIGKIRYIYTQRLNLGRIRDDVNALWNLAPHDISILQYWLDGQKPLETKYNGTSYVQKGIDDVSFLNLVYPNNVLANIHVSWLDPNKVRRINVVGSKKMIVYDDIAKDKVVIYDKGIDIIAKLENDMDFDNLNGTNYYHRSGDAFAPKINWIEPLKVEINHFVDCITNETPCLTDPEHAKQVISILSVNKFM